MIATTRADKRAVRRLWNKVFPALQVSRTWWPREPVFIAKDASGSVLAVLVVRVEPHPIDGELAPRMLSWFVNPDAPVIARTRGMWRVAKEMAEHYIGLGYHRTFGFPDRRLRRMVTKVFSKFRLKLNDREEPFVDADDGLETMDFLRTRGA